MRFRLRGLLTFFLVGAAAFFLGDTIVRQASQVRSFDWDVQLAQLLLSILVLTSVLVANVAVWGYALRGLDYRLGFASLARIWFLSNLARYIPGKIWQFVGVAELSRSAGVPAIASVTSIIAYMGYVLLAAWFVGIYLVSPEMLGPAAALVPIARVVTPLSLFLLHPRVLGGFIALAARITGQECASWQGGGLTSVLLFGASIALWFGFGFAFFLFIGSLTPVSFNQYPDLTAAFALAFFGSYVVVVAPGGLGVKEGLLAALMSSTLPLSVAAAVAVASRLWSIVAEVVPAAVLAFAARDNEPT